MVCSEVRGNEVAPCGPYLKASLWCLPCLYPGFSICRWLSLIWQLPASLCIIHPNGCNKSIRDKPWRVPPGLWSNSLAVWSQWPCNPPSLIYTTLVSDNSRRHLAADRPGSSWRTNLGFQSFKEPERKQVPKLDYKLKKKCPYRVQSRHMKQPRGSLCETWCTTTLSPSGQRWISSLNTCLPLILGPLHFSSQND